MESLITSFWERKGRFSPENGPTKVARAMSCSRSKVASGNTVGRLQEATNSNVPDRSRFRSARRPRHAARVTRGGRIPRLDRHHAGAHEPFEQLLDLVVQQGVVDRRRSLTAEREEQLLVLVGEGLPVELVQRLQDADDLALHR